VNRLDDACLGVADLIDEHAPQFAEIDHALPLERPEERRDRTFPE
jgi:hypothetical protein